MLHRDRDDEEPEVPHGDREITLGTTMILAIFFALAVFAAIFFGFGYSMGSKRAAAAGTSGDAAVAVRTSATTAKPGAGNASNGSDPAATWDGDEPKQASAEAASTSSSALQRIASTVRSQAASPDAGAQGPALPAAQQPVVQIAAVSHQQDADLLVSTLKRRGYAVTVHSDPHDKLLHVQVGPFATRPEAQAMRQRLIGDGFNAIVKDPAH